MFSRLFSQLVNSCGIVFRTFRAFFMRQIVGVVARFRRLTSFSRQAAKLVPKAVQSAAVVGKKPTKREDYFETKRLFISKSLIVILVIVLLAIGLLGYYIVWPWAQSAFFTAHIYHKDEKAQSYSGKVVLYYDEEKTRSMQLGKLQEGFMEGFGQAYDEEGRILYAGNYAGGLYEGKGELFEKGQLIYEGDFVAGMYEGRGKLYQDGLLLYEGEFIADTYNGEGNLYEDGSLLYTGGFMAGIYEGSGSEYANGALRYKGGFQAGAYHGFGSEYVNGALRYEGGYQTGIYQGEGALYSDVGKLVYKGGFHAGVYEGEGALYNEEGRLIYRGGFLEGLRDGEGVEYTPATGQIRYRGTFMGDLYERSGELFNADGSILYEGGFRAGQYHGAGTLHFDRSSYAEAEFDTGAPLTHVRLYRDRRLYYEGAAVNFLPHGEGEIFMANGTLVYQGMMRDGTIDGMSLLGLSADEARAAFADAPVNEVRGTLAGFSIHNGRLGVTLFSSLKTDESDPVVHYVYLYGKGADALFDWVYENASGLSIHIPEPDARRTTIERPDYTGLVPFSKSECFRDAYYYDEYIFVLWSEREGSEPFMAEWISASGLPVQAGGGSVAENGGASRLDALLGNLGLTDQVETDEQSPYYDDAPPDELLALEDQREQTLLTMVDYVEHAETKEAVEAQLKVVSTQLKAEQERAIMGKGDPKAAQALETQRGKLELTSNRATVGMEKAKLAVETATGKALNAYNVALALFVIDPAMIDVDALTEAVKARDAAYEPEMKLALMDLELAYQEIIQAQDAYTKSTKAHADAASAHDMGKATEQEMNDALFALSDARIALYSRLAAFSRQMIALNTKSGGYLAREFDYFKDIFE